MTSSVQEECQRKRLLFLLPDLRKSSRFGPQSLSFLRVAVQMGEPSAVQRALDRLEQLDSFIEGATGLTLKVQSFTTFDLHLDRIGEEADAIRSVLLTSSEDTQAKAEKLDRDKSMSGLDYADIYGIEPSWEPVGATSQAQAFRQGKFLSGPAELDRAFSAMEDMHESSLFDTASPNETFADRAERLKEESTPKLEDFLSFM